MLINSDRNVIGWQETFISKDEIVDVSVVGNLNKVTNLDEKGVCHGRRD